MWQDVNTWNPISHYDASQSINGPRNPEEEKKKKEFTSNTSHCSLFFFFLQTTSSPADIFRIIQTFVKIVIQYGVGVGGALHCEYI